MTTSMSKSGFKPENYLDQLILTDPLRKPLIRSAIKALQLPAGGKGLDVGCGIGTQAFMLADEIGSAGQVIGLDLDNNYLDFATESAQKTGFSGQVSFQQGNMNHLPYDNDSFDWAWSMDCVGYYPADSLPPLRQMVRVVRPGGIISILAWSSQMLLPGYPKLEAHLDATTAGIAPFRIENSPQTHFLRTIGRFEALGLKESSATTLLSNIQAPLKNDVRRGLLHILQTRWAGAKSELMAEEWAEYQRLCQPESPDFILDMPDYYAFYTYTMFRGVVPG